MLFLLQFQLILCLLDHNEYTTLAQQYSLSQASDPVTTITNASIPSPLARAHSSSHTNTSASGPRAMDEHDMEYWGSVLSHKTSSVLSQQRHIYPRSNVDVSTELPAPWNDYPGSSWYLSNFQDILSGFCTIGDNFCSFKASNGSIMKANVTGFHDGCVLWDDSCSGNRTEAIKNFFDNAFLSNGRNDRNSNGPLLSNLCFVQKFVNQSDCDTYNPPERLSEFQRIKNWMRSSQCISAADEWIAMTGYNWGRYFSTFNEPKAEYIHDVGNSTALLPTCCGGCLAWAENVDLFYWPEPDSDTSCLSVIGSVRPIDYGATTESGTTYWACNWTESSSTGILTTAQITTVGSLTVKVSNFNPWSSSPCGEDEPESQDQSTKARDRGASVYRRAHSLIIPTSITETDGLPVSTMISGNFTL